MTTTLDARRSPSSRAAPDGACRYVAVAFAAAGGRLLGLPGRAARRSSTRWRENNHHAPAAAAGAARRAVRSPRQDPGREPDTFNIALVREQTKNLDETLRLLADGTGVDEAQLREIVESPPPRAQLPADRPDRERHARAGHGVPARRLETAGHHRAGSADAELSGTRTWRRTCSATSAKSARRSCTRRNTRASSPASIVGQAGVEQAYNRLLMGKRRRRRRSSSTASAARSTKRDEDQADRRPPAAADDRRRRAERRPRTASAHFGFNGAAPSSSIRASGEVLSLVSLPGVRPERFAGGIDLATWAALEHRPAASRCRTARCRDATRRARRSRSPSPPPRSKRASSRPTSACSAPAARPSTAATSSATRRAATARSTCGTRSSSRATSTSTPSATCSASIASTSGRRCSASA